MNAYGVSFETLTIVFSRQNECIARILVDPCCPDHFVKAIFFSAIPYTHDYETECPMKLRKVSESVWELIGEPKFAEEATGHELTVWEDGVYKYRREDLRHHCIDVIVWDSEQQLLWDTDFNKCDVYGKSYPDAPAPCFVEYGSSNHIRSLQRVHRDLIAEWI